MVQNLNSALPRSQGARLTHRLESHFLDLRISPDLAFRLDSLKIYTIVAYNNIPINFVSDKLSKSNINCSHIFFLLSCLLFTIPLSPVSSFIILYNKLYSTCYMFQQLLFHHGFSLG